MQKIIDYLIVESNHRDEFVKLVQSNIKDWGWQPFGSVSECCSGNDAGQFYSNFVQAMVKYE